MESNMHDFDRINFGKYEFSQEECPVREVIKGGNTVITGEKAILYINSGLCKTPNNVRILHTVKRMDNSVAFRIVSLN